MIKRRFFRQDHGDNSATSSSSSSGSDSDPDLEEEEEVADEEVGEEQQQDVGEEAAEEESGEEEQEDEELERKQIEEEEEEGEFSSCLRCSSWLADGLCTAIPGCWIQGRTCINTLLQFVGQLLHDTLVPIVVFQSTFACTALVSNTDELWHYVCNVYIWISLFHLHA
jgi:hypothetical protein